MLVESPSFVVRPAAKADEPGVQDVVRAVYEEYGFTWDPEDYHADLYDLAGSYPAFWVAEADGRVLGCVGLSIHDRVPGDAGGTTLVEGTVRIAATDGELVRLYVHPDGRRRGMGEALSLTVAEEAERRGIAALELWSDKRFGDAHRLYGRLGAQVVGERICHDPDQSPEWGLFWPMPAKKRR